MVVLPEPAVKCGRALLAVAVDRSVCPTAEHGADESLCLAVGLWPVGPGAQVANPQCAAGDRVDERAIAGAVIREQLLDGHAVAGKELDSASEKRDDGDGLLIAQNLGV